MSNNNNNNNTAVNAGQGNNGGGMAAQDLSLPKDKKDAGVVYPLFGQRKEFAVKVNGAEVSAADKESETVAEAMKQATGSAFSLVRPKAEQSEFLRGSSPRWISVCSGSYGH